MSIPCEKFVSLELPSYNQLICEYDAEYRALWYYLNPQPRSCFTPTLLNEILDLQQRVSRHAAAFPDEVHYLVLASATPSVFNLGGDLRLFIELIKQRDRNMLRHYGELCINAIYNNATNLGLPSLTTISLVQGSALGGGFEAALSSNVIIAESSAQLGFPEILFNLFPGMGAYNLLARRIPPVQVERLLRNGEQLAARELYAMGVIDEVAEDKTGTTAVRRFIRRHVRAQNGHRAIQQISQRLQPLSYDALLAVLDIWVEAAMRALPRDLRTMERLATNQDRLPRLVDTDPSAEREPNSARPATTEMAPTLMSIR